MEFDEQAAAAAAAALEAALAAPPAADSIELLDDEAEPAGEGEVRGGTGWCDLGRRRGVLMGWHTAHSTQESVLEFLQAGGVQPGCVETASSLACAGSQPMGVEARGRHACMAEGTALHALSRLIMCSAACS